MCCFSQSVQRVANTRIFSRRIDESRQAIAYQMGRAAFARADAEEIPQDKLLTFMHKYPPVLWKDKPGSAEFIAQCKATAETWHAAAKADGLWKSAAKEDFLRYTQGLGIGAEE